MLFRIVGHWLLESSLMWLHLFLRNNWGQAWNPARSGRPDFVRWITRLLQKHQILIPRRALKRQRARGSWSKFSKQWRGRGGGMEVGTGFEGGATTQPRNLTYVDAGWKISPFTLGFTSPSHHLLPSVQSDLCYLKRNTLCQAQCLLSAIHQAWWIPSPVSSLGLVGVIYKEAPGEEEDALGRSVSVCEEGWKACCCLRWGGVEVGLPDDFCPRHSLSESSAPWINPKENGFSPSIIEYQRRLN